MRHRFPAVFALGVLAVFVFSNAAMGAEPKGFVPDKALCAKMLRLGKESYSRGKYLDAKEYFRKAVQADPTSDTAWRHYDQTVIFGLAEKVEKDAGFLVPDVSTRAEAQVGAQGTPPMPAAAPAQPSPSPTTVSPPPASPPPASAPEASTPSEPKKKPQFKIVNDEGC